MALADLGLDFLDSSPCVLSNTSRPCTTTQPSLDMIRLELVFRCDDVCWLPPFRGSLWRGALGPALKRLEAAGGWHIEDNHPLPQSLYRWIFDTSPAHCLLLPQTGAMPHPLIIDAPPERNWRFVKPGESIRIQISLVGRFACAWRSLIIAFHNVGQCGIGRAITREGQRGRLELMAAHQVWMETAPRALWNAETGWTGMDAIPVIMPPPQACPVRVNLATPMRVKRQGRIVRPRQFEAGDLFSSLIRRVSALMASETGTRLDMDFHELGRQARQLKLDERHIRWHDLVRWSASQNREVPIGGITGSFVLDMTGKQDLFDFLWIGQWVNIGKGAFMGTGSIRLQPL